MEQNQPPSNFRSVIGDFTRDLSITFPEYANLWEKWTAESVSDGEVDELYKYCVTVYPERFFDILYQNEEMFSKDGTANTHFLPNVDFKLLVNCEGISDNTKKALWKYLQLVLFSIIGGVKDKTNFGETMNMFDGIDESELQSKLNETMSGLTDFFKNMDNKTESASQGEGEADGQGEAGGQGEGQGEAGAREMPNMEHFKNMFENMPNMPNMEDLQGHLKTLFDGKIGKLAKEMAEEISGEFTGLLDEDMGDATSTEDVMKKLMKNPKKIMDLMKKVGGKLDTKMKNGEISRDEIMKEAGDLLSKMKEMGGKEQFTEMLKTMAKNMGGLGKNMRVDTTAIDRMTKQASTRERMRNKMELKKQQQTESIENMKAERQKQIDLQNSFVAANHSLHATQSPDNLVFRLAGEEVQEKSFIHPDLLREMEEEDKKKTTGGEPSKSSKKKKNKNKK